MAIATADEAPPPKKGPSLVMQLIVLLAMTGLAVGGGWFFGRYLHQGSDTTASAEAPAPAPTAAHAEGKEGEKGKGKEGKEGEAGKEAANALLVDLAPMTTNLAAPSQVWVRLEASLVLDAPQPPELVEAVHQDLLAYLRTLTMHQVEGPSGYQHLRADLNERASIRSEGHVREVLIRTLLFE